MNLKAILFTVLFLPVLAASTSFTQAMEVIYYHNDTLGSPRAATDENGNILWRENYAPYGKKLENQAAEVKNHIGYTGKPHERITGLTYMNARFYDPVIGRFMAVDPVDFRKKGQQYFQRYTYAGNNPYRYFDPTGEELMAAEGTTDEQKKDMDNDNAELAEMNDVTVTDESRKKPTSLSVGQMIRDLQESREIHTINPNAVINANTPVSREDGQNGKGTGSATSLTGEPFKTTKGDVLSPREVKIHELYHAWQNDKGIRGWKDGNSTTDAVDEKTGRKIGNVEAERSADKMSNAYRSSVGEPPRRRGN